MKNKEFKDAKYRDPVFISMMVKHNEDMHRAYVREMVDKFINRDHIHECEASCSVYGKAELECPVCGNPIKTDKKTEPKNEYIEWLKEAVEFAYKNDSIATVNTKVGEFSGKVVALADDGFFMDCTGTEVKFSYNKVRNFDTGLSEVEL